MGMDLTPPGAVPDGRRARGRPTLRDVAALAGVSFKTVSRVVNGEPGVRPETAERVLVAVREIGFQPNVIASSLKRGTSQATIGLVIEDVSNPFFAVVARAVEEVTRERGPADDHGQLRRGPQPRAGSHRLARQPTRERPHRGADRARPPLPGLGDAPRDGVVFIDRPPGHLQRGHRARRRPRRCAGRGRPPHPARAPAHRDPDRPARGLDDDRAIRGLPGRPRGGGHRPRPCASCATTATRSGTPTRRRPRCSTRPTHRRPSSAPTT